LTVVYSNVDIVAMISLMTSLDVIDDVTSVPDLDRVIATNIDIDIDKTGD
jgi:hypothetical protein